MGAVTPLAALKSPVDASFYYNRPDLERALYKADGVEHIVIWRSSGQRLTWQEFQLKSSTCYVNITLPGLPYNLATGLFRRDIFLSVARELQLYSVAKFNPEKLPELSINAMRHATIALLDALQCVELSAEMAQDRLGSKRFELLGYADIATLVQESCDTPQARWRLERVMLQRALELLDVPE